MKTLALILTAVFVAGCAGTQTVNVSPNARNYRFKSVHVVTHGGNSGDMDMHLQKALLAKNLNVTADQYTVKTPAPDIMVKYVDSWKWDLSMYLASLDITILDKSGNILATGNYQNTFWHEWPDAGEKVNSILNEIFSHFAGPLPTTNKP